MIASLFSTVAAVTDRGIPQNIYMIFFIIHSIILAIAPLNEIKVNTHTLRIYLLLAVAFS